MIKHSKTLITAGLVLLGLGLHAQEVVSTQGDAYSNASGSIDFTIGEVVINTGTDGANSLTQGFHQTNWNLVGLEDHTPSHQATIFPNPTSDILNIQTSAYDDVSYTLHDAQGKLVIRGKLSAEQTPIQVSQIAPGNYSLTLSNTLRNLKTFKLLKLK